MKKSKKSFCVRAILFKNSAFNNSTNDKVMQNTTYKGQQNFRSTLFLPQKISLKQWIYFQLI